MQKIVRIKQIILTAETNLYTCRTNSTNYQNKTFVRTKQITYTHRTNICKGEQIFIEKEQIIEETSIYKGGEK
jgi:hypothetical protein